MANGAMQPWPRLNSGLGMIFSGSKSRRLPKPLHSGQAPTGELNENSADEIDGNLKPQTEQEFSSLNSKRLPSTVSTCACGARICLLYFMLAAKACANESATRPCSCSLKTKRSITMKNSVLGKPFLP